MATRPKAEAEVIQFRRGFALDDEAETPLASAKIGTATTATSLPTVSVDLTGKPKAWFLNGPNGSGKTTLARWMGWKLTEADRLPFLVALDPTNRSLATWFDGVLQPETNDGVQTARWLRDFLDCKFARNTDPLRGGFRVQT